MKTVNIKLFISYSCNLCKITIRDAFFKLFSIFICLYFTNSPIKAGAFSRDTIYLKSGKYENLNEYITSAKIIIGDTTNFSVIINDPLVLITDSVTLIGLCWDNVEGNNIEIKANHTTINNCHFRNFGKNKPSKAIWIKEDGLYHNTTIQDCHFYDWGSAGFHSACIKVGQKNMIKPFYGTLIKDNHFFKGPYHKKGNNVAIQLFCPSMVINNVIWDCEDAIEVKGNENKIINNVIFDCTGDEIISNRHGSNNIYAENIVFNISTIPITVWTGQNNTFINNVIYNSGRIAHIKGGDEEGQQARNIYFKSNYFVGNMRGITWDLKKIHPSHIFLLNNLFYEQKNIKIEGLNKIKEEVIFTK